MGGTGLLPVSIGYHGYNPVEDGGNVPEGLWSAMFNGAGQKEKERERERDGARGSERAAVLQACAFLFRRHTLTDSAHTHTHTLTQPSRHLWKPS